MQRQIRAPLIFSLLLLLLADGCFLASSPHSDYRPIHQYSLGCQPDVVQAILKTNSAAVNLPDDSRRTPLHAAASRGCTNVISILLRAGTNIEAKDKAGETPLHVAAQEGFPDAVTMLIQAGASTSARDHDGYTPLGRAVAYDQRDVADLLRKLGAKE